MIRRLGEDIALMAMRQMDPERAHGLAIRALKMGLGPKAAPDPAHLTTHIAGLEMSNPIGLAAGFDKNGEAITPLMQAGFGFVEIGAVTPRPQAGNPRPRLFRLKEDEAVINRFGFNNAGMEALKPRLDAPRPDGVLGVNFGANKDSEDRSGDYALLMKNLGARIDFATINVSSPNTEKLRDLQGIDALRKLIESCLDARETYAPKTRLFLKIAPDLSARDIEEISMLVHALKLDALIATNTTIARPALRSRFKDETGGLSGKPLALLATEVIRQAYAVLGDDVPIIGVGGIDSVETAKEKLDAGAKALQLYTALVYKGMRLIDEIKYGLPPQPADKNMPSL